MADLLQSRAQVAAEHKANPVYFHAMDAGLGVTFLHPLQVGFLLRGKVQVNCQVSTKVHDSTSLSARSDLDNSDVKCYCDTNIRFKYVCMSKKHKDKNILT